MKNKELQIEKCRMALLRVFKKIQNLGAPGDRIEIRGDIFEIAKVYSHEGKCYKSMIWYPACEQPTCFTRFIKHAEIQTCVGSKLIDLRLAKFYDFRHVFKDREEILARFIELYEKRAESYKFIGTNLKLFSKKLKRAK